MPAVARFDTPGSLRDLPAGHPFYDDWHTRVAGLIDSVRAGNPRGEFFDPSSWDFDQAGERRLTWMGLPRERMVVASRDDRRACFAACEDRNVQEEYIEWRAERRADGKITKVALVTETPEYWEELARADRARVMALYRQLVGPAATEAEVFSGPGGAYNRGNPWNTERGIVHYIQDINTLAAAVGLAQRSVDTPAQGSVNPGPPLDNFDIPTRAATSADPRVALDVAALARRGLSATLREPVGLYMAAWDDTGWTMPDGRPVGDYWTVRRGAPGAALRLEYRVPPSEGFVVGDIRIGGRPIEFGGQIAEHVTVTVGGVAGRRR